MNEQTLSAFTVTGTATRSQAGHHSGLLTLKASWAGRWDVVMGSASPRTPEKTSGSVATLLSWNTTDHTRPLPLLPLSPLPLSLSLLCSRA